MINEQRSGNMQLAECLAECLANSVVLQYKAQGHHWNVKGPDFTEYHAFFKTLYEDYESAVDTFAEFIRYRGVQAPFRLTDFVKLSSISDKEVGSDPIAMLRDLQDANKTMINCCSDTFKCAEAVNDQGIMDFIAGRLGQMEKWNWQISAHLGEEASLEPTTVVIVDDSNL